MGITCQGKVYLSMTDCKVRVIRLGIYYRSIVVQHNCCCFWNFGFTENHAEIMLIKNIPEIPSEIKKLSLYVIFLLLAAFLNQLVVHR